MSFAAFLLYMALAFLRPIELFWPELEDYRPMLWLWLFAFGSALIGLLGRNAAAGRRLYFGLLAAFVVTIAVSQVVNSSMSGAVAAVSTFSTSAMLFVLSCMNLTSLRRIRITCTVLLVCVILNAAMGVAAYRYGWMVDQLVVRQGADSDTDPFLGDPNVIPAEDTSGQFLWRVRSLGFLNDPNDFAQVLVLSLPFLWGFYEKRRAIRNLLLVLAPTALLLYTIYLTHSRGAIVGLGALVIFAARRRLGTIKMAVLAAILVFVASVANIGVGGDRAFSTHEESANERIEAWYSGLQMLKSSPIIGVGYGNFVENHALTAHNSVVLCFAELGMLGYFFWGAMLVLAYRELDQTARLTPPDSPGNRLASMLLSSFVGFMVCAWFLSRTYQPTLYLLLAFCASTAWCARRERLSPEGAEAAAAWPPVSWLIPTLIANVVGIAAVYGFVTLSGLAG